MSFDTSSLPAVNATLNGTSSVLLFSAWLAIKSKRIAVHRALMLAAVATSALFLVSYLTYHAAHGSRHFLGQGWIRPVYFSILISHTVLAALVLPLVGMTLYRAWRRDDSKHRAIARWTLPIWLYVSVTGVVVYWLLYQVYV